jgi:V/A-type H+/Na+-transporting ATPase subunit C
MKRIELRKRGYPYTFARVSVMKTMLLKKSEYHKLLRMRIESIVQYLGESTYKSAIDKLAIRYSGVDLMEHSLNLDLVQTFSKLRRISAPEVDILIDSYAMRWDMYNIKTILRGIYSKSEKEYVRSLLLPAGALSLESLGDMMKQTTIEGALRACKLVKYDRIAKAMEAFEESGKLIEIENQLDHIYFENGLEVANSIGKEGQLFAKFLLTEIDMINIRNLLRMKREGFGSKETKKYLVYSGQILDGKMLDRLAMTDSIHAIITELRKTEYGKVIHEKSGESLIETELELDRYLIKKSFLYTHQYPMSVMAILTYMMNKIIEVKNLKSIARAKQLGIDDKFIEEKLIVM